MHEEELNVRWIRKVDIMKAGLMQQEMIRHRNGYSATQLVTLIRSKLNGYTAQIFSFHCPQRYEPMPMHETQDKRDTRQERERGVGEKFVKAPIN